MKLEMFEKVGEINIIALRSAVENKAIAEVEQARKAEEERIRKEAEERESARIANDVLMKLINAINARAEKGGTNLYLQWNEDAPAPFGVSWSDYNRTIKHILPILEAAGYEVSNLHVYSEGWRRRSGKLGYTYIFW